jgi:hypothetical protein
LTPFAELHAASNRIWTACPSLARQNDVHDALHVTELLRVQIAGNLDGGRF